MPIVGGDAARLRFDLDRRRRADDEPDIRRDLIDMGANRDTPGKPYPCEDRIDIGQTALAGIALETTIPREVEGGKPSSTTKRRWDNLFRYMLNDGSFPLPPGLIRIDGTHRVAC